MVTGRKHFPAKCELKTQQNPGTWPLTVKGHVPTWV